MLSRPTLGLLAGALLLAAPAAATASPLPEPQGRTCAFSSIIDPAGAAGRQVAVANAGPLVVGGPGTLVCTVAVNGYSHWSPGAAWVSARAAAGTVVVLPPTPFGYAATAADTVALCTSWVPDSGPTLYWTSRTLPERGSWSTDRNAACSESWPHDPNYPSCPLWLTVDKYAGTPLAEIWQDCEPFEPFEPII